MIVFMPLLAVALAQGEPWFHPGRGPGILTIHPDSTVNGIPVRRTGALLLGKGQPDVVSAFPGVRRVEELRGKAGVLLVHPEPGVDELALSRSLRNLPGVEWAHPDLAFKLLPSDLPDDPYLVDQWHLENTGQSGWTPGVDIDASAAWSISNGQGSMVAIIDSGVDLAHPDLWVVSGWDYVSWDSDSNPDLEDDAGPHGTATAGLAAAIGDNGTGVAGVAWGAQIYAIRLIGDWTSLSDMYDAFVEAVDAGASVLSNSWGFYDDCTDFPTWGSLQDALDYAEEEGRGGLGAAVVASAGNGGCDVSGDGFQLHPSVISVAATDGDDQRESYSSYGDVIDIAAPSGGLLTTDVQGSDGYGSWNSDPDYYGGFSGTSASAPIVSGVLALMFAANPLLSAQQAREVLCDTAVRVDPANAGYDDLGWSPYYGCGRVDAAAAVMAVANELPETPEPVGPLQQAWEDLVLLRWEPADDPDGDWLEYEVTWWTGSSQEPNSVWLGDLFLDITGQVAAGQTVTWQVAASDPWGKSEASEPRSFSVLAIPQEGGASCSAVRGSKNSAGIMAILAAAVVTLLRRPWVA